MKGVTCLKKQDMYLLSFDTYDTMLVYITQKRPSQLSVAFDGKELTGSIPVAAYRVLRKEGDADG